jgi:hypothetical protein
MVKGTTLGCFQEAHKSFVDIMPDELKIKPDLWYHNSTGELISYVDLFKVTNEIFKIDEVEKFCMFSMVWLSWLY